MDAHDFSRPLRPGRGYTFGVGRKGWARSLRKLADEIDAGVVSPQQMTIHSRADKEDFTLTTIVLKFAEMVDLDERKVREVEDKLDRNHKIKNLWVEHQFPDASALVGKEEE